MKLLIFLLSLNIAWASPVDCFKAASDDDTIGAGTYYRARLCRKATSTAPYKCYLHNKRDFRFSHDMLVDLCSQAVNPQLPSKCFDFIARTWPGKLKNSKIVRLCSGVRSIEDTAGCFHNYLINGSTRLSDIVEICSH